MKKKKNEKRNEFVQWMIAAAVLFIYFLIILLNYGQTMMQAAKTSVNSEIAVHGDRLASSFAKNIATVNQATQTAAAIIAKEDDVLSDDVVAKLLYTVNTSMAEYGYICDAKGKARDIKGNSMDVWDDDNYAQVLTGVQTISDIDLSVNNGKITFYAPINASGTVKGVVCLQYSAEQFSRLPHTSEHDGLTVYALMKDNGDLVSVVGPNKPEIGTNLYDIISPYGKGEDPGKKLKQCLENSKSGQQLCLVNGDRKFINYRLVGTNGWYVLEIYTGEYYNRLVNRDYRPTQKVMVKMLIALFLFFGVVILINILNKAIYTKKSEELQSKAETDLLTGLLNKIATEKRIQEYIDGEGSESSGMLFVLDIDNFKKINDTMGHAFGDQVLSTLGIRLRNQFRVSDIIGRIGGDEFIVYLKNINDEDARQREANRVIEFFKDFRAGDYVKYSATASIGVSLYPQDGSSFEELYKAADKGVYLAKQRGKNQLAFYSETK